MRLHKASPISASKFRGTGVCSWALAAGIVAAGSLPGTALAQAAVTDEQSANSNDLETQEIIVTGTLLRNVAPAGTQTVTLDSEAIQATGATSTSQLMATVPQLNSFGNVQTVNSGGTQLTVNRINLRNLPQGIGGSSPTLVLMDGHRMVGMGVKQSYPDPDVIPPALIQRVDVVTDGGSATYGADAVGGVVNFITRDEFDGFQLGARQGFADSYSSTDVNFTAGKTWGSGAAYVGYNFARHGALFGRDRDFIQNIDYETGAVRDLNCSPANVIQNNAPYAVVDGSSLVAGMQNFCDLAQDNNYVPAETRHSVMAGFRQDLSDSLEFKVKGYFSERRNTADGGPRTGNVSVAATNPNYISTGDGSTANQTVYFDFAGQGKNDTIKTKLWAFGITPSLRWGFGNDWEMRAFYNYGQSKTTADDPGVNDALLASYVTAGSINPYDIGSSDPMAISQVLDFTGYGIGKDTLHNARVTFDGPLFRLPGGDLQLAVGGEYIHEKFSGFVGNGAYQTVQNAALNTASREVKSVFAELNVPLVGPENGVPLVHSLTIAAAGRYDHYSDFGSNWAPNIGATWNPIEWISLRARWNKSFQAPSLVQLSQASTPTVGTFPGFYLNFVPLLRNPDVPANGGPVVAVQGTVSPLEPQKATGYNLGFDISPPVLPGLNLHFTYFNIDYSGQISQPPLGSGPFYEVSSFQNLFVMLPTISELESFLAGAGASTADIANTIANVNAQGGTAYVVADVRARNLGVTKVDGFDFGFDYRTFTSFGSINASLNGSYTQNLDQAADGVNFLPNQAGINFTRFNMIGKLGADIGEKFRGQITWNHLGGFDLSVPAQLDQMKVGSFDTIDLYLQYKLEQNALPPITFSLAINNVFDTDPPLYRGVASGTVGGYWNGSTVGRLVQLGASIEF